MAKLNWFLSSDHGGVNLKAAINEHLQQKGFFVEDLGCYDASKPTDYPDNANVLAKKVLTDKFNMGILVCGTGIGVSIRANRYIGVRAALISNELTAKSAKAHSNANVLCFGERVTTKTEALKYIDIFLQAEYEGGRHEKRLQKLDLPIITE